MLHPLHNRIKDVARRAQRLELLHGVFLFAAVAVAAAICLGLADYLIRFHDPGVRVISSVAFLAATLWAFTRFLRPLFGRRHEDVAVAQHVEQRFPQFRDRLSSSIQFLTASAGSAQLESLTLQQAVIAEAEKLADSLDLTDCLSSRATRRAVAIAMPVLLLGMALFVVDASSAQLVLRRLALPLSSESWPRWNQLAFNDPPRRLAAGQDFELTLRDLNGHLPAHAIIQLWFDGDSAAKIETRRIRRARDRMIYRRENLTRALRYRAIGGDDDTMEWITLEVVEPPAVEQLAIRLQPPAYSGLVASEVSRGTISVLLGTTINVTGRTSQPVSAVELRVEGVETPFKLSAQLQHGGRDFSLVDAPLEQIGSGRYWLKLVAEDGVIGGHDTQARWQVIADAPPELTIVSPGAGDVFTPQAVVPLHLRVADDLAVKSVTLEYRGQVIPLYEGPTIPAARQSLSDSPDEHEVVYSWDLRRLNVEEHESIEFSITATDYKGQTLTSPVLRLSVIAREDFADVLQERQKRLREQLSEALRSQDAVRGHLSALVLQLQELATFTERDQSLLQGCELQQRQIQRLLGPDADGAAMVVSNLITAIESNRVEQSETLTRLHDFASQLGTVNRDVLPEIRDDLVRAGKAADFHASRVADVQELLIRSQQNQDSVIASLRGMIDQLSGWDDYRRFTRDLAELLQSQQELQRRVDELPTLGKPWDELSVTQRSDLLNHSAEQGELLRQVERLLDAMTRFQNESRDHSPNEVANLSSALETAVELRVADHMHQGKGALGRNQLGSARRHLRQATDALEAVLAILSGRVTDDQLAATRRLGAFGEQLDQLLLDQRRLQDRFAQVGDIPNASARQAERAEIVQQQRNVARRAREMSETLGGLGAREAANAMTEGADAAERAANSAEAGRGSDAETAAEEAEARFAEASRQVNGELKETRERLLDKTSARLARTITELATWQRELYKRFVSQQARLAEPDGAEMLQRIEADQSALAEHTAAALHQFQPPRAFALAMTWVERSMRKASARFAAGLVDEETGAVQLDALRKLESLLKSLQPGDPPEPTAGANGGASNAEGRQGRSQHSAAELRVLLGIQADIHQQTEALSATIAGSTVADPSLETLRDQLAADQQSLADLVADISKPRENVKQVAPPITEDLDDALQDALDDAAGQSQLSGDFDERLLVGLDPPTEKAAGEDLGQRRGASPLADIAARMLRAAKRVHSDETLEPVLQLQEEVMRDLEELANQAAQQSSQQSSQTKPRPKPGRTGDSTTTQSTVPGSTGSSSSDAVEAVWGSLPEHLRQQIRSPVHEEFLPQYEHIIQEYYKRLAEDHRSRSGP